MRSLPRISITAHGLIELVGGLLLLIAAFALDLGGAGTMLTFAAGAMVAGVGLTASETLPISAHQALDRALAVGLAVAAVACALSGGALAAVVLLSASATILTLEATTHWSRAIRR